MRIIVCEDLADDRRALCGLIDKYLKEINCPAVITAYDCGDALVKDMGFLKGEGVRIAFLDIYMPGLSGIDVARKIRETDKDMVIIFTTTSSDHGLDGFAVKAHQYLLKPVGYSEVKDALDDCMAIFADELRFIEVVADRVTVRIPMKDITYIEIIAHDCRIHTTSDTIKCRLTLDEMERMLVDGPFLRTHRSYIVNMRHIKSVAENDFLLTTGAVVPIRRNDKLAVKQAYMDYVFALARRDVK